jgi:acetyl/propionyl-CoA carboxylase alpha subunit
VPAPRGYAIQLRVNTEKLRAKDGLALPASGTLTAFEPPEGPGVRTDTAGHVGYASNPRFDSLLAKVIVHSPSPRFRGPAAARAARARRVPDRGDRDQPRPAARAAAPSGARRARVTTRFVEEHSAELVAARRSHNRGSISSAGRAHPRPAFDRERSARGARARQVGAIAPAASAPAPPGAFAVRAPLQGTIASFAVARATRSRRAAHCSCSRR